MFYQIDEQTVIRSAKENEVGLILQFIKELALYEKMLDDVSATEELLQKTIFQDKKAEVIFCDYQNETVGFALFFHNYSTFLGKPGLYLEDLFIRPEKRNLGLGKKIIACLSKIAVDRECGRMDWSCLDWNQKSIDFYLKIGAVAMSDWTVYRLTGESLTKMAESFNT